MKKSGLIFASFFAIILLYLGIQHILPNETDIKDKDNSQAVNANQPNDQNSESPNDKEDVNPSPPPEETDELDQLEEEEDLPDLSYLDLHSTYALLVRLEDGNILLDKNSKERMYPASLTKIMTAIVAIESISNIRDQFILPYEIFPPLYEANAALAGFVPGEEVTVLDLLYGTLLPSGAEASIGLAQYVADSEENFVQLMNEKAIELGMTQTNFTNVTGLHHENHYSTAEDMAKLLSYALKNEIFTDVFTSPFYSTNKTNKHPEGITVSSTMFKRMESNLLSNGEILGGKTGYTDEAGLCLASIAIVDGEKYMLITAGAPGTNRTEPLNIIDAFTVYNEIEKY